MLIALFAILLYVTLSPGTTEPMSRILEGQKRMPTFVKDTDRAHAAAEILLEMVNKQETFMKELKKLQFESLQADRDYNVTLDAYKPILAKLEELQATHHKGDLLRLREDLKEQVTQKEWKKLFK